MPFATTFERLARQEDILEILQVRFGQAPSSIQSEMGDILDSSVLKALVRQALTASSLEEFQRTLDQVTAAHQATDPD